MQSGGGGGGLHQGNTMSLPIVCLIPKNPHGQLESKSNQPLYPKHQIPASKSDNMELMDEEFLKKHFNLPKRALYLDPMRRPLITFPMTQEDSKNFNLARKYKINQQILDGILDPSAAISAPSIFVSTYLPTYFSCRVFPLSEYLGILISQRSLPLIDHNFLQP